MSKSVLVSLMFLLCVPFASAGSINSASAPSLDTSTPPPIGNLYYYGYCFGSVNPCTYFLGMEGSPGSGSLANDLNSLGTPGLSVSFVTGPALTWSDEGGQGYEASFGYGGSFQITLANGLNFNGVVTSGVDGTMGTLSGITVSFFGQWSNGQYGFGSTQLMETPYGLVAQFNEQPAPEPSTFAMFGTGLAGLWGLRRKFLR
jgi:PEP-CTERM motif